MGTDKGFLIQEIIYDPEVPYNNIRVQIFYIF